MKSCQHLSWDYRCDRLRLSRPTCHANTDNRGGAIRRHLRRLLRHCHRSSGLANNFSWLLHVLGSAEKLSVIERTGRRSHGLREACRFCKSARWVTQHWPRHCRFSERAWWAEVVHHLTTVMHHLACAFHRPPLRQSWTLKQVDRYMPASCE